MNKTNDVTRIMSETLDKYRNAIPRKAFIRAMERVVEDVLAPTTCKIGAPVPGIQIVKRPDVTAGELAELLSGACPPFTSECEPVHCHATNCRDCWLAWLATGKPANNK